MHTTSQPTSLAGIHRIVWTAICAALVAIGAMLVIPMGSVPFSMQPMFVALAGFILGPVLGGVSILLYLVAGAAGLPVFTRGMSGVAHLFGPTGGFLFGFVLFAVLAGVARRRADRGSSQGQTAGVGWISGMAWGLAGLVALYALGLVWLKFRLDLGWWQAFLSAVAPFFPLGLVKLAMAVACVRLLARSRLLPW